VPTVQPISIPRGEDTTLKLSVKKQDGTAQNLTGTLKLGIRKFRHSTSAELTKTGTITSPAGGLVEFTLTSAELIGLVEHFEYLWDVQWTDGAAKRWQLVLASPLLVLPIVHRPGE
jgi:hypothetical protein